MLDDTQIAHLLNHGDSPHIRAIGFLYLRYVCPHKKLITHLEPCFADDELGRSPRGSREGETTVGAFVRDLVLDQHYFETIFPRIPEVAPKELVRAGSPSAGSNNSPPASAASAEPSSPARDDGRQSRPLVGEGGALGRRRPEGAARGARRRVRTFEPTWPRAREGEQGCRGGDGWRGRRRDDGWSRGRRRDDDWRRRPGAGQGLRSVPPVRRGRRTIGGSCSRSCSCDREHDERWGGPVKQKRDARRRRRGKCTKSEAIALLRT